MNTLFYFAIICALGISEISCKKFNRCDLARELVQQGFDSTKLRDWVCLVEAESSRSTSKINSNRNGSRDYGLFQINDRYWCEHDRAGKDCNVNCEDLLIDDITIAAKCAKKVFKRHGFQAWYGWKNKCQGSLPDLSQCSGI